MVLPLISGSTSIARLARSTTESFVETVLTGLDSPVDVMLSDGDISGFGSAETPGDGGDEMVEAEGDRVPEWSPSSNARRSPVERLNVIRDDRSGEDSPLLSALIRGDFEPLALGVESPSVEVCGVLGPSSRFCMARVNESHDPA
jgi:hypothetical protein